MNGTEIMDLKVESSQNKYSIIFENANESNSGKLKLIATNNAGSNEFEWNIGVESIKINKIVLNNKI